MRVCVKITLDHNLKEKKIGLTTGKSMVQVLCSNQSPIMPGTKEVVVSPPSPLGIHTHTFKGLSNPNTQVFFLK